MSKNGLLGVVLMLSLDLYSQSTVADKLDVLDETLKLPEVVITGTRYEILVEKSGKTIYKLSAEDIEKNAGKTVSDLLNEVPGVQML